jgi:acyl-coenzyme A synthetase/AMP-(fatty) acid ligase
MPGTELRTLWKCLIATGSSAERQIWSAEGSVCLSELRRASSLEGGPEPLLGRSILIATTDQLSAALALVELDGIARRLILCPPDVPTAQIPSIVEAAAADAILLDRDAPGLAEVSACAVMRSSPLRSMSVNRCGRLQTEWILLTSGTTGVPKLVMHTLSTLSGAVLAAGAKPSSTAVWSTFYDIRRYGGLQVFLRAMMNGGSLVLSSARESIGDFLMRLAAHGTTHISGTPSHWRRALMSPSADAIEPQYVRLSGEIADQPILDRLRDFYRRASVVHAFASTEAGVAFDISDGLAGFPASLLEAGGPVEMRVINGSLRVRSNRTAIRYVGHNRRPIADTQDFIDTGDLLELRDDRYLFVGRKDGVINVGGLKVHPEEVETVINGHPTVWISRVRSQKNPFTGAIVAADIVAKPKFGHDLSSDEVETLKAEILTLCGRYLERHKIPAVVHFVPSLNTAPSGKLARAVA